MIVPPGFRGAAFGEAAEGDGRVDPVAKARITARLGSPSRWAYATQVHGRAVVRAETAGRHGEADALFTDRPGLTLAVATADCVPVVLEGPGVVAVIHAGWRGARAGVVEETIAAVEKAGLTVERAAIGPAIGPCCYEVGEEVAEHFPDHLSTTTWGTAGVDLVGFVRDRLEGISVWSDGRCTRDVRRLHSFRRDRTRERQVSIGWIPEA